MSTNPPNPTLQKPRGKKGIKTKSDLTKKGKGGLHTHNRATPGKNNLEGKGECTLLTGCQAFKRA